VNGDPKTGDHAILPDAAVTPAPEVYDQGHIRESHKRQHKRINIHDPIGPWNRRLHQILG
jgi:hypothetical protein